MEKLNKNVIEATKKKFDEELETAVQLIHFTQEPSRLVLPDTLKGQECPMTVRLAHQFAVASSRIKADMIESTEFPHLVQKYNISGVLQTVINETVTTEGAVPEDTFLENVLKVLDSPK